jgi:hypothetical protein
MERMAFKQTAKRQPHPFQSAIFFNGFHGVSGTSGMKAAMRPYERGYAIPIN